MTFNYMLNGYMLNATTIYKKNYLTDLPMPQGFT